MVCHFVMINFPCSQQQLDDDNATLPSIKLNPQKGWKIQDAFKSKVVNETEEEDEDQYDEVPTGKGFIDDEAELSGSDASSDESEGEDDDKLEENEADKEDLPDEEEQRDDILRLKNRQDMDEDIIKTKQLQEKLFEDGEFHREGTRLNRFAWRKDDSDDERFNNTIRFNSDEEDSEDDDGVLPPTIITYKDIKPSDEGTKDEDNDEENMEGDEIDEFESIEATRFEGAFGGPAGSILSYVIRDKATHEKMTDQKEVVTGRMGYLKMKRKKFTRKGPIVKTVSEFEKRKWFSKL